MKIFNSYSFSVYPKHGCVRIGNYVLSWRNQNKFPLLFSERNGYTKYFKLGNWIIKFKKEVFNV